MDCLRNRFTICNRTKHQISPTPPSPSPNELNARPDSPNELKTMPDGPNELKTMPDGPNELKTMPDGPNELKTMPDGPNELKTMPDGPNELKTRPDGQNELKTRSTGSINELKIMPDGQNELKIMPDGPNEQKTRSTDILVEKMAGTDEKKTLVDYNWLSPNSGLKVSNICFGAMTFGTRSNGLFDLPGNTDEKQSIELLNRYTELGGNFIDTANVYTAGESEEIIGKWMRGRDRSSVVVATKVRFGFGFTNPNLSGLGRASILDNLDASLKRLQTDYIDLYYAHGWDAGVKLEETLRTFNDIVRSGKARYIGLSNVTGAQLQKIIDYNKFLGFDQSVVLQPEYNLLERNIEHEIVPTVQDGGLALVPYSPLKSGLLTGKFKREDANIDKSHPNTRLSFIANSPVMQAVGGYDVEAYRKSEAYWELVDVLENIAKKHGKTVSQVSIRWLLQREAVSSVIIGAKTMKQLEENMAAGSGWSLTDEEMQQLTDASAFGYPSPGYPFPSLKFMNADRVRKF